MKDLEPNILNDYEHRIARIIEHYGDEETFPRMEQYGVAREELDSFLSAYQDILDSEGTQRQQLTVYGIIAVLPVLVLSAFPEESLPWGNKSLFVGIGIGIGIGLLLALMAKGVRMLVTRYRLSQLRREQKAYAQYADAVDQYLMDKTM